MFRALLAIAVSTCLVASAAAQQQGQLPAILSQAVNATEAAIVTYAFDLEYTSGAQRFNARFEPRSQPSLRLLSPERATLSSELRADFDSLAERLQGITWCAGANMSHITDVRLLREDATTTTFSFQPTRESVTGDLTRRIVSHLRGELTVLKSTPDIIRVHIFAPQPFNPAPFARVERYTLTWTCAVAPNGRHYVAESVNEFRASMAGRTINTRGVRRTHDLGLPR